VAPRAQGVRAITKGVVLDRVVDTLPKRGYHVNRGQYIEDFLFDAVIRVSAHKPPSAVEVLSFATSAKEWTGAEHDAGHFLYAVQQAHLKSLAVVQPPDAKSLETAIASYKRVLRWFNKAGVPTLEPHQLADQQLAYLCISRLVATVLVQTGVRLARHRDLVFSELADWLAAWSLLRMAPPGGRDRGQS